MNNNRFAAFAMTIVPVLLLSITGCGGMRPTVFIHQEYNFGYMERVAVIPFENLTKEQGAAARATRFFITELLASESFDVIEPGEVSRVLAKHSTVRADDLTQKQIVEISRELNVQGLFLGSVNEASALRAGSSQDHIVTIVARLVEREGGETVWTATHTEGGRSFWASLFGGGKRSQSEVMRECVRNTLATLVD